ncbi:antibiotic biosynthesis monooxygenase [Azohydromonas caseinilytica]|uniref:Antibiotic biosynthesis monooxygenase n=1 Tax=Azohydromonas caseinilytica TaxID=2728836 RepID=A0A848FDU2_9BURK|nr:antibiotic biosynthesis monooxygenase [Azohydromonas caseinilytica]NML17186.1 antibiotic biosynthesis monooxygenase [Azohydromonas caseinilytica]
MNATLSNHPPQPGLRRAALSEIEARAPVHPDMVTAVIRHEVRPGAQAAYEQWLQRIVPLSARVPGHRGVNVIRPPAGGHAYTVTLRFDSLPHAEDWLQSEARRELIARVQPLLVQPESVETVSGLEFWCTPPGAGRPLVKPWKQFLVSLSAIYPLTLLVPWLLAPLFARWPALAHPLLSHLLVAGVVVSLMTWVLMPRVTRVLGKWLTR